MSSATPRRTLPQKSRLKKKREFQEVYGRGRRVGGRMLTVWVLPRSGGTRTAYVAGRRVGRAVARNRAKRLMREAFRQHQISLVGDFHIVMSARPECPGATYRQVAEELRRQLTQAGCLGTPDDGGGCRAGGGAATRRSASRLRQDGSGGTDGSKERGRDTGANP